MYIHIVYTYYVPTFVKKYGINKFAQSFEFIQSCKK